MTIVNYYCTARHLYGMNNPLSISVSPQHHCLECKKSMCGSLCDQLISEQSVKSIIPKENLSEEGQQLTDSPSALICHICIEKCSIEKQQVACQGFGGFRKCCKYDSILFPAHDPQIFPTHIVYIIC